MRKGLWLGVAGAVVAAVTATGAFGGSSGETSAAASRAAAKPTLAVVVVGPGRVTSTPAGISCPGRCSAAFATGARVLLTQKARTGSRFLRWGGDCTGAGACRVRVSGLAAVAAQFVGSKPQPPPAGSAVEPGGYSGRGYGGYGITFLVPAGAGSVLDFSSPSGPTVSCVGGGQYTVPFTIAKATIRPDRSFTAKTSQSAVVGQGANAANATITYSVTGRFQGTSAAGAATAAGVYRVDIVFADTPNRKCTSNDQQWTAARSQPPTKSVQPGPYSGRGYGGYGITFLVPAGAGSVLDFSSPSGPTVSCVGGGQYTVPFTIAKATIRPDRSFTAKTSQSAVVGQGANAANATITRSVTGRFQGTSAAGAATAAGVYRVDIVFAGTPNRKCTSNDQQWTAARTG